MSFEPHLGFDHHHSSSDPKSFDSHNSASYDAANLLAELDKIAPIKQFDAFPKNDLGEYLLPAPTFSFNVDPTVDTKDLQLNVDLTVAMGCHCECMYGRSREGLGHIETERHEW